MPQDHVDIDIAGPRGEADIQRFASLDAESFAGKAADSMRWLVAAEQYTTLRLARIADDVVGGYILLPVGQFFGGRSVPARCVSAVAVHPAARRRGVAGALMRDCVAMAREQGASLAPLHAATVRLYRRWGWEVCARTLRQSVRTAGLGHMTGVGTLRAHPERSAVEALRRTSLVPWDGPLDRPDWWLSVEWDPGDPEGLRYEYGWYEGDVLTGFVRYEADRSKSDWIRIRVQEFIFSTPDALRGLLGFLGGQESQSDQVVFVHSAIADASPLLFLLPEAHRDVDMTGFVCWMQRIVDVERAMTERGWPQNASGRVDLEVADPVTGVERFILEVEGGGARVSPGGSAQVRCGVGALSAWYSSAIRAEVAATIGLMEGDAAALAAMDGLIAGGVPWMPDFF